MFQLPRFYFVFITVIMTLLLSACQGDNKQKDDDAGSIQKSEQSENKSTVNSKEITPLREVVPVGAKKIVQASFLHNNLPESTLAYARIPNFWSFIGTPKGNVFDTARQAQPFFNAIKAIREGVSENVIPDIPDEDGQLLANVFFKHLTSPIEAIVIEGVDPAIPTPNAVFTVGVDFSSVDELQLLLDVLAKKSPQVEISKNLQEDGYAELTIAKMNVQVQWDQEKSRLIMLLGLSLSPNNLSDVITSLISNPTHQMKALENTIDSSGEGIFVWANPRKLSSIGSALGMQRELAPLAMMGVSAMKNIAMGAGTSNGINRLKYVVEMPVTGFRSYMPIINDSPNFDVMGKTKMVVLLGLPSRADFVSIENTMALVVQSKDMEEYFKVKKEFNKTLGFSVEDIFDFFGQDISYVNDEAGSYVAIRLNDAEKFKTTLANSVETLGLEYKQREISGHTYHHLKIPSFYAKYIEEDANKNKSPISNNKLLHRLFSVPSHFYWEQEGDYLILANIPQTLIDRHYVKTKTPVKEWLANQQKMDPDGSLLMVSMQNQGTAKKMYRMHLGLLNYLADFSGKPIDMFAFATPQEAKIPNDSRYGFKVASTEKYLSFELNYENNPYEFLLSGGTFESVALLGILSSIALPAYDDYTVRAKLSEGIIATTKVKADLNEFEIEYGRYPNQYEISDLKLNFKTSAYSISIGENTGEINLKFNDAKLRSRNTLKMIPPKQGVSTTWRCEAKINRKYLPSSCR